MERGRFRYPLAGGAALLAAVVVTLWKAAEASPLLSVQANRRVITPNGDGINDTLVLQLPDALEASATVISKEGRPVCSLPAAGHQFVWDGRDADGRPAESGVYLIQVTQGPARWNGVVAVAR